MSYTCPQCGMTSHNPEDERQKYCGHCHAFEVADADGQHGGYILTVLNEPESTDG
jgi:hypothetical protein